MTKPNIKSFSSSNYKFIFGFLFLLGADLEQMLLGLFEKDKAVEQSVCIANITKFQEIEKAV